MSEIEAKCSACNDSGRVEMLDMAPTGRPGRPRVAYPCTECERGRALLASASGQLPPVPSAPSHVPDARPRSGQ